MTEAEIIEGEVATPQDLLALDVEAIQADMLAMDAAIKQAEKDLTLYDVEQEVLDSMPDKEVDACAKALNADVNAYETARKSLKARLSAPYDKIKAEGDRRMASIKRLQATYKDAKAANEQRRKKARENELIEHYEAYAGLLLDVVPYQKLHDPKWLNKTVGPGAAKAELEAKVDKIAADWDALKGMGLEFQDAAEAEFFKTLDLGSAVSYARKLAEDKAKIDAMKAEIEQLHGEPEVQETPQPEPQPIPQPIPQPVPKFEPVRVWALTIEATDAQMDELMAVVKRIGIHSTRKEVTCG